MANWNEEDHPRVSEGKKGGGQFTSKGSISSAVSAAKQHAGIGENENVGYQWADPDGFDYDGEWITDEVELDEDDNEVGPMYQDVYVGTNLLESFTDALRKANIDFDDPELLDGDMDGDGESMFFFSVYVQAEEPKNVARAEKLLEAWMKKHPMKK